MPKSLAVKCGFWFRQMKCMVRNIEEFTPEVVFICIHGIVYPAMQQNAKDRVKVTVVAPL